MATKKTVPNVTVPKTELALTQKQVLQLAEIAKKFPDTEWFTIHESSPSGIGAEILVRFKVFSDQKDFDTTIDITDVGTW
jgi:hypothetical protein